MDSIDARLRREYTRWCEMIDKPPPEGKDRVTVQDALRAHVLLLDTFSNEHDEGFGGAGPRNVNLLISAIDRQHVGYGNEAKWTNLYEWTATVFFGLIKNHAFHDGNKRTALLLALYQLVRGGRFPNTKQKAYEDLAVSTAAGTLDQYLRYRPFAKRRPRDAPVLFLADFFRRCTRPLDKGFYVVTYRQLDGILKKHGYWLDHPAGNFIGVYKKRRTRSGFLKLKLVDEDVRVLKLGFPGWKKQVGQTDLKKVLRATSLTPENGVDSGVFFKNADPMEVLIERYNGPLLRLADK